MKSRGDKKKRIPAWTGLLTTCAFFYTLTHPLESDSEGFGKDKIQYGRESEMLLAPCSSLACALAAELVYVSVTTGDRVSSICSVARAGSVGLLQWTWLTCVK